MYLHLNYHLYIQCVCICAINCTKQYKYMSSGEKQHKMSDGKTELEARVAMDVDFC